jgi:hypothetical protein
MHADTTIPSEDLLLLLQDHEVCTSDSQVGGRMQHSKFAPRVATRNWRHEKSGRLQYLKVRFGMLDISIDLLVHQLCT